MNQESNDKAVDGGEDKSFVFPKWTNYLLPMIALGMLGGLFYVPTLFAVGASPKATAVGYSPVQPVPYSHKLHVGQLGMDCRYCHNTVEKTAFAALPPTATCMNCHSSVLTSSPKLAPIRDSWQTGKPMEWIKIHNLPQYVYFNHSSHVTHGVSCVECHGRIDTMEQVYQAKPLSMGWCLECHRDPASHLRPLDQITNLAWTPETDPTAIKQNLDPSSLAAMLMKQYQIHDVQYMTSCSTCHR